MKKIILSAIIASAAWMSATAQVITKNWAKPMSQEINTDVYSMDVDTDGNFYVLSRMWGSGNFESIPVSQDSAYAMFVAKYNAFGTVQWVYKVESSSYLNYNNIAVSSNGNVTFEVAADTNIVLNNGAKVFSNNTGDYKGYLVTLKSNGAYLWHKELGTNYSSIADMKYSEDGEKLFVLMNYDDDLPALNITFNPAVNYTEAGVFVFTKTGNLSSYKRFYSEEDAAFGKNLIIGENAIYINVAGYGQTFNYNGVVIENNGSGKDEFIIKLNSDLSYDNHVFWSIKNSNASVLQLALDKEQNVFVHIYNYGGIDLLGEVVTPSSGHTVGIFKLDENLNKIWFQSSNVRGDAWGRTLNVDTKGNIFIGFQAYQNNNEYFGLSYTPLTDDNSGLIMLDPAGNAQEIYMCQANDYDNTYIAKLYKHQLYVVGYSYETISTPEGDIIMPNLEGTGWIGVFDLCNPDNTVRKDVYNNLFSNDVDAESYQWYNCATSTAIAGATNATFTPTENGQYKVVVTVRTGCKDTSDCITVSNVGIEENEMLVEVYPNPFAENITIDLGKSYVDVNVKVLAVNGAVVYASQLSNTQKTDVNLNLPTGMYFVVVNADGHQFTKKIVRQ